MNGEIMDKTELKEKLKSYKADSIKKGIFETSEVTYNKDKCITGGLKTLIMHKFVTRELISSALDEHNTNNIFKKLQEKFKELYSYDADELQLIDNRSMDVMGAFIDDKYVFFDSFLEETLHPFFIITIIWAKYFDDKDKYGKFFNYLTGALYAVIKDKGMYNIYENRYIKDEISQWTSTVNLAVSCQYFCMYFCLAHEIAHGYIKSRAMNLSSKSEEYKADSIAYEVVLSLMEDEETSNVRVQDRELFEYCYLAPMMLFDMWDLIFYTERVLFQRTIVNDSHPSIKKRKENLFSIPYDDDKFKFDTEEGNAVYNAFTDVIDKYKTELLYRNEHGLIDELIRYITEGN